MSASPRARPLSLGAEAALAFGAATAAFALIAVALAAAGSVVVAVLIAAVAAATVVVALRRRAVAYAVPVAMAGLIAFDWYQLPPTHPHEFPDAANLADLLAYLGVA